ncbi:MAG: ATP-binding protein [Mizugakiibacter sp.]|uniref:sensor histidine kinase n=1 Tax=Mizugakiibacter sp. TaxID=1972610 RepID=UPI00320C2349
MKASARQRASELEQAFALFNDTSRFLAESYRELEQQVALLGAQLAAADAARQREFAARERLAERMQGLLEVLPGGVVVLDDDDRVQDCNAGAHELFDEPLLGQPWAAVGARAFGADSDGGTLRLADGRSLAMSTRRLSDGGHVLLFTDVTEARTLQARLERHERLSAMGEMSARLAHQLRTPLAAAVLYASRLAEGGLNAAIAQRLGEKIQARLHHLERLIADMLAFARGDGADAGAERIEVAALLAAIARAAEPQRGPAARLEFDDRSGGAVLRGQRELLASALTNLAVNGLQAAGAGGCVRIDAERIGGRVRIGIRDDGPGIAPELAERIFEPFFTTRSGGTGLGLAVARAVVAAHGGEIAVQAEPGAGALFVVSLPEADAGRALRGGERAMHNERSPVP